MHPFFKYTYKCILFVFFFYAPVSVYAQAHSELPAVGNISWQEISNRIDRTVDTAGIMKIIRYVEKNVLTLSYDSSITLLQQTTIKSKHIGYPKGVILSLLDLGQMYTKKGLYQQSIASLYQSITYALGSDDLRTYLPEIYSALSAMYHVQGNYANAAKYMYQSALLSESLQDHAFGGGVYNNLGTLLIQMEQYPKARYYLNKAEQIAVREKDYGILGNIFINKAISYAYEKNYKESLLDFQAALYVAIKYNQPRIQYSVYLNLANQALINQDPQKAINYLQQAIGMHIHVDPYHDNAVLSMLGEAYVKQKQYKLAEATLVPAEVSSKKLNLKTNLREVYRVYTALYAGNNDYKKAFDYYNLYTNMKDSISNQEIAQNISSLDIRYRTAQKDKELMEKQLLITRQARYLAIKNSWIIAISAGTLILLIAFIALYRSYRHKTELEQLKASMAGEEKERNRIGQELHDGIGGMLTAIKMNLNTTRKLHPDLMQIKSIDEIISMVQDTANEVRKTAHNLMPDVLLRYTLPEALLLYNEQINSGSDFKIDFHFYGDLGHLDRQLALSIYRIIQEFIQNIIKHAQASHAEIQVHRHDTTISITVEDNGIGFNNVPNGTKGLGLQNLKARVHALQGYISIESAGGKGTTAYIEFDLKKFQNTVSA